LDVIAATRRNAKRILLEVEDRGRRERGAFPSPLRGGARGGGRRGTDRRHG
jgi:hypothetical protein